MIRRLVSLFGLLAGVAAAQAPARAPTPVRDPLTPGYVAAKELPEGENPKPNADGNFIIGATHNPAPEMTMVDGVPHGTVYNFTMEFDG